MKQYRLSQIPYLTVGESGYQRFAQPLVSPEIGNHEHLSVDVVNFLPHSQSDGHAHPDRSELIYFLNDGAMVIDGQKHRIEAHSLVVVEAGEMHSVINESDELLRIICIFSPALPKTESAKAFIREHLKAPAQTVE